MHHFPVQSCIKLVKLSEASCYCGDPTVTHCGKADSVLRMLHSFQAEASLVVNWQDKVSLSAQSGSCYMFSLSFH